MQIIFYLTEDCSNTLNKDLTEVRTINGSLRDSADLINPVINIEVNDISDVTGVNYCYIPELERYYFIERITAYRTHIFTLYLSIDVLQTYKDKILQLSGYINQQAQNINYYYDSGYGNEVRKEVELFKSDITLPSTSSTILTTIGG